MASLRGDTYAIYINTGTLVSPTWTLLGKVAGSDEQSTRQTQSRAYFGSATPDTTRPPRETTLTLNGTRDLDDAGQIALYGALSTSPESEVHLRVMNDDNRGYEREFQVNDESLTTAPEDFQDFSVTLSPTGDKTPVDLSSPS